MSFSSTEDNMEEPSVNDLRNYDFVFEAFVKKHYQQLCFYCKFKFGFDIETAEDIVSTSFIKFWEARYTLDNNISPKSYLYKIIHNTSLNTLKHEKVKQQYAQEVLCSTSESIEQGNFDNVDLKQLRADIRSAISELPDQMRKIFELSKFEGLKYDEIATELNISHKTVKTQMSRAFTKLREKLSQYYLVCFILLILLHLKNK